MGSASRAQKPIPASRPGVEQDASSLWSSGRLASAAAVLGSYAIRRSSQVRRRADLLRQRDFVHYARRGLLSAPPRLMTTLPTSLARNCGNRVVALCASPENSTLTFDSAPRRLVCSAPLTLRLVRGHCGRGTDNSGRGAEPGQEEKTTGWKACPTSDESPTGVRRYASFFMSCRGPRVTCSEWTVRASACEVIYGTRH
jgi:hypothetical protein